MAGKLLRATQSFAVLLYAGRFETPVVVGKVKKSTCFKSIDRRKLSVSWKSNKSVDEN